MGTPNCLRWVVYSKVLAMPSRSRISWIQTKHRRKHPQSSSAPIAPKLQATVPGDDSAKNKGRLEGWAADSRDAESGVVQTAKWPFEA